jgi:hypothetical protein
MDLLKIIAELQIEKRHLDEAIDALERLGSAKRQRRGRSARWAKNGKNPAPPLFGVETSEMNGEEADDIGASAVDS